MKLKRLDRLQVTTFAENGYVTVRNVFTKREIAIIRKYCAQAIPRAMTEHLPDGFRSWRAVTHVSRSLASVACDSRLLSLAVQILGPSIKLIGTQLIHRQPHCGPRFIRTPKRPGWHRDIYGMHTDLGEAIPQCAIKCAIWLTDAKTLQNGATRFLPGSHVTIAPIIAPGEIDPAGWVSTLVCAGDVTIFENRTFHAGGLNTSNRILEVFMLQYGYRWLASIAPQPHSAEILKGRKTFAKQILEPNEWNGSGEYMPGSGAAAVANWAKVWGIHKVRTER